MFLSAKKKKVCVCKILWNHENSCHGPKVSIGQINEELKKNQEWKKRSLLIEAELKTKYSEHI